MIATAAEVWRLLDCAMDELAAGEGAEVPSHVVFVPGGQVAVDECCEGLLYARIIAQYPTTSWPNQVPPSRVDCGATVAVSVGLGIWRCSTGIDRMDQGGFPTDQEQSDDAALMLEDAAALWAAICCAGGIPVAWQPLGPDGGCYGGEWTLWLRESED